MSQKLSSEFWKPRLITEAQSSALAKLENMI